MQGKLSQNIFPPWLLITEHWWLLPCSQVVCLENSKLSKVFQSDSNSIQTKKMRPHRRRNSPVRTQTTGALNLNHDLNRNPPRAELLRTLNSQLSCTTLHQIAPLCSDFETIGPRLCSTVWLWLRPNSTKKIFPFYHPWNQWNPWLIPWCSLGLAISLQLGCCWLEVPCNHATVQPCNPLQWFCPPWFCHLAGGSIRPNSTKFDQKNKC